MLRKLWEQGIKEIQTKLISGLSIDNLDINWIFLDDFYYIGNKFLNIFRNNKIDMNFYTEILYLSCIFGNHFFKLYKNIKYKDGEEKARKGEERYQYIRFFEFYNLPDYIFKRNTFVDIGCGLGDKLFLAELRAHYLGTTPKIIGIEISDICYNYYCKYQWRIPNEVKKHIKYLHRDVFNLTNSIKNWDTIYTYMPIPDNYNISINKKQLGKNCMTYKFYNHVMQYCQKDTIWVEVLPNISFEEACKENGFEQIDSRIWRKK
jgi:SAM-dependent methyltransferase